MVGIQTRGRGPLEANLRWAFRWTFWFATIYSGYVAVLAISHGTTWFPDYNLSLWTIVAGYYAAALFAGTALGLLRPLGSTRLGAYILGAIVGYLVYASVGVLIEPSLDALWFATIPALITGGLGVVFYDDPSPGSQWSPTIPKSRMVIYAVALLGAILLLWLDLNRHLINK
jgi:hypothetical protein